MTLRIESLSLRNFRSYHAADLADLGDITVLVGENAVGKTNLIEAIQLLTSLTSFRHSPIDQLLRRGEERALASLEASDGVRQLSVELRLEGKARKYRLNGKAKRPIDLKGLIPSVVFTPDDLGLAKGSNSGRRTALDTLGAQVNKNYYAVRRDYEKVLRHKNRLLKDEADPALVAAMDEMVVTVGSQLACYRVALLARLVPHLVAKYAEIAGAREQLSVSYGLSWASEDEADEGIPQFTRDEAREGLARALHERAGEERRRARALVGPHADTITFRLDGQDASLFGSQGQQRSVVLAYKLAEAAVIEELLDQKPLLLLDDVMSELDGRRREALVDAMAGGSQTFITTANIDYFDKTMLAKSDIVQLPLSDSSY
ncbi:DNA replication/repair protein RecF [uncultured Adlercreutzia sp.]|uniref:DNA replication/repair protein RecF n=1 Tax=uncultured Adlercreutzia sp. TaxID=875803 RepID=UPI0025CE4CDC|nr:DNA replication and repair protein RecF [uncultured Adlercreutzia sp.]